MNGFLLIDKPVDWTSRDVCNKIQHILNVKKVGHIGTLDPFATGLLVVTVGNGTKAGTFLEDLDKEYIAELKLGAKTNTGDKCGEIIKNMEIPSISKIDINNVLHYFIGEIEQIPPMTSAIHVNGQKLYKLAHEGIEIERQPRKVLISSINLLNFSNDTILFSTKVSKGTYIRTLGEDIAERLSTVGYLENLRRTKVGSFNVNDAIRIDEVSETKLIPIYDILSIVLPTFIADEKLEKTIRNGASISQNLIPLNSNRIFIANKNHNELAIYERKGSVYTCLRGLW